MATYDLIDRLLKFAVDVIFYCRKLDNSIENKIIKHQLIKSSTSSGANYEESQGSCTTPDFIYKVKISLKEMRESNYWLRVIKRTVVNVGSSEEIDWLIDESDQLRKILGSIVQKKMAQTIDPEHQN